MLVTIRRPAFDDMYDLACQRDDPKVRFNQHSAWRTSMDAKSKPTSLYNHLVGLLGEYATGQLLGGADVDRRVWADHGDRDEADISLVVGGGTTVQVKTRTRWGWDFALSDTDPAEFRADLGVLVYPSCGSISLAMRQGDLDALAGAADAGLLGLDVYGYITRLRFLAVATVHSGYGYGKRLVAGYHHFTPFKGYLAPDQVRRLV
jgi:hypothetical protein